MKPEPRISPAAFKEMVGPSKSAPASWSAAVLCRFGTRDTEESGRGQPHSKTSRDFGARPARCAAFSLAEMLVVIAIIGILAAIGIPALKGFGKSNSMTAALRQFQSDIAYARQKAMSTRSTVFMVFVPTNVVNGTWISSLSPKEREHATNLFNGQYTSYALFSRRSVGEQPGRETPRYLSDWRSLPDGVFIAERKFQSLPANQWQARVDEDRPFAYSNQLPFPAAFSSVFANPGLPHIAFNAQGQLVTEINGQLVTGFDEVIPLASGSIFYARDSQGNFIAGPADVQETPPGNSMNITNRLRIDWLSGRTTVERSEIQ
jgi:prepilin-type N-terminal cleavage/methylation domain-containing protein